MCQDFQCSQNLWDFSESRLIRAVFSSVQFSCSVMSDSLWPHESQHARPPCPSPTPGVHTDSRPSSQWCHPAISSSVVSFSSCPQSLPASDRVFTNESTLRMRWPKCWSFSFSIIPSKEIQGVILKILQARLQQYMNCELPDVQDGFRKGRGTRNQTDNIRWIFKKAREFQKNIYFCFIDYAKAFDCVDHNKLWKILKEGNTRTPDLSLEKFVCSSRRNS